jgi:pimeloyl-ACP methyl ester carboxylesterase
MKRTGRAHPFTYPRAFRARQIAANGTKLYVRIGGSGPPVVLLHGYGETGDMWVPLAEDLARDHTLVVPDLRGMGLSAKPAGGYDKKTQAGDVAGILDAFKLERAAVPSENSIRAGFAS